jgi:hypothetical protein
MLRVDALFIRLVDNAVFAWVFGIAAVVVIWSGLIVAGWFAFRQVIRYTRSGRFGTALLTTLALCSTVFVLWAGSQIAP